MGSLRALLLFFLGLEVGETMKSLCGSSGTMAAIKKEKKNRKERKKVLLGGGGL